jgi:hypothetical protein
MILIKLAFLFTAIAFKVRLSNRDRCLNASLENQVDAIKLKAMIDNDNSTINCNHPVIQSVLSRYYSSSKPQERKDKNKIALCIEGGGMRGCTAAGATAAINFLGFNDCIDVVYGSSAGSMVAAYFISRQFSGISIYHGYKNYSYDSLFIFKKNFCIT